MPITSILSMIEAAEYNNAVVLKVLSQEVDMYQVPAFKDAVLSHLTRRPVTVILDLEEVNFLDSSALGALFFLHKTIKSYGGDFSLAHLAEPVSAIMRATQALGFFSVREPAEVTQLSAG